MIKVQYSPLTDLTHLTPIIPGQRLPTEGLNRLIVVVTQPVVEAVQYVTSYLHTGVHSRFVLTWGLYRDSVAS
jgi:hypothetical protein